MDNFLWLFVLVIIAVAVFRVSPRNIGTKTGRAPRTKQYNRRDYIMTNAEAKLFRRLEVVASDRYYIFPQIHLSSLLDHKVKGQDWRAALSAIQRKSVDFALVDKTSLKTMYVIELDDSTHDWEDRIERDVKVARYMAEADMPLVRLRDIDKLSDDDICASFVHANERTGTDNTRA